MRRAGTIGVFGSVYTLSMEGAHDRNDRSGHGFAGRDREQEELARESGIGRLHGIAAMNDFLETKHIYLEEEN